MEFGFKRLPELKKLSYMARLHVLGFASLALRHLPIDLIMAAGHYIFALWFPSSILLSIFFLV